MLHWPQTHPHVSPLAVTKDDRIDPRGRLGFDFLVALGKGTRRAMPMLGREFAPVDRSLFDRKVVLCEGFRGFVVEVQFPLVMLASLFCHETLEFGQHGLVHFEVVLAEDRVREELSETCC